MKSRQLQGVPPAILGLAVLLGAGMAPLVHAQATQTADQRVRLTTFALVSYMRTHDNGISPTSGGSTVGGEIDGFRLLPHTDVGLDVRYTASNGNISNQRLFAGGPRISFNAYRFRPYADYLIGRGQSNFNVVEYPGYTFDVTRTRGYGAGFDYRVTRYWSFRADAQRQRWRFSVRVPPFYPVEVSAGVAYQVHFGGRHGPQ